MTDDTLDELDGIDIDGSDSAPTSDAAPGASEPMEQVDELDANSNSNSGGRSILDRLTNTDPNPPLESVESPLAKPDQWHKYLMRGMKKAGIPIDSAAADLLQGVAGFVITQADGDTDNSSDDGTSGDNDTMLSETDTTDLDIQ